MGSFGAKVGEARRSAIVGATLLSLAGLSLTTVAAAQRPGPKPPPAPPPTPPPTTQAAVDMMAPVAGGITSEQVGLRAMQTSFTAKAALENVSAASARSDAALVNFVPHIGLVGRYTKLSEFTPPTFGGGGPFYGVISNVQPPQGGAVQLAPGQPLFVADTAQRFPLAFDQWLLQATITLPISDYFLKINQGHSAALRQEEAARFDHVAARAKSYSDGRLVYFTWLRARGAQTVAEQTLSVAQAHQRDAENLFNVGNASKADVLRAQTQVAVAELAVERAKNGVRLTERQLRIAIHAKDDEQVEPGEGLDAPLSAPPQNLNALVIEAQNNRPEVHSIEKNAAAARKVADAQGANRYPVLAGFGDVTYADPNPRRFPQVDPATGKSQWFPTWQVGAQITWSPSDLFLGGAGEADAAARAAALAAQRVAVREGVDIEVTTAFTQIQEADIAIHTTKRQLESATEGYRVARELFNNGRGTATTMIDAEVALAQARFDNLNARVDARLARIRLDHAVGRDTRVQNAPSQ